MRLMIACLFAAALSACPAHAQEADEELAAAPAAGLVEQAVPGAMARAVDGFIRPGYRDLVVKTVALADHARPLCDHPSPRTLERMKRGFTEVVASWSRIEIVRLGPALEANRFERILFFPDRKSTGLKQVQRILATGDETAVTERTLKAKSVAAQGLGALEYVLYGTGAETLLEEPQGFRCRYAAAIADNLATVATELSAAWERAGGLEAAWKAPGPDNPLYRTNREAATELLGILVHGVEQMRDQRLRPFFAGSVDGKPDPGHPKLAIYWRSGETMDAVAGNARGLKALFDIAGLRDLLPPERKDIATSIDLVFADLVVAADSLDVPVEKALASEADRARLLLVLRHTNDVLQRLNLDFGGAIGLGAGFSFADGD